MDLTGEITDCLRVVQEAQEESDLEDGVSTEDAARIAWVRRQLYSLSEFLRSLQVELDSGLSASDLGYDSMDELQSIFDDIRSQASMLRGMLRLLKALER